LRSSPQCS